MSERRLKIQTLLYKVKMKHCKGQKKIVTRWSTRLETDSKHLLDC